MGYYGMRGDYYRPMRGDYYRGDFWSAVGGFVKGAVKGAVGAVGGFVTGGPMGAIAGGISAVTGKRPGSAPMPPALGGGSIPIPSLGPLVRGAAPSAGVGTGKKRRRMNVTNSKALRRAIRRAKGFEKLSRKVLSFVSSKPPRGRGRFKSGRRSR